MLNIYLKKGLGGRMTNWVDELIPQYKKGRRDLKEMSNNLSDNEIDRVDKTQINSMIDSMGFSIDWMETGRQPGVYRGADRRDVYRAKQYDDMDVIPDITEQLEKEREPLYMSREQRIELLHLFRSFSDRERQCFIMYEAEQLSMQKIADKLGLSKWTVRTYIDRAKGKVEAITA